MDGSQINNQNDDLEAVIEEEIIMINDAELLGVYDPEMDELLAKPVKFMTGELWDQGDYRNTKPGKWKLNEMPWADALGHPKSPLTNHAESRNKQGASIVLGETIDGNRNAESVKSLYAVVIDVDSGPKVDDVIEKLQKLGYFALVYTSYNHNKAKVVLKHDEVMRKLKINETPTRLQIIEYLRTHSKDRYDDEFLDSVVVTDARKHGPKGLQIVLETTPLHKFRIVLPLWEPVELADLGTTTSEWKEAWADLVTGFVVNELGISFDATSCDVNRLFYLPRHPKGDENWDMVITQGKPLRIEDIKPHSKNEYVKNRDNDPFAYGFAEIDDRRAQCEAPSGMVLNAWHTQAKERFMITDVLLEHAPDKVRREVSDGKLEIECPFEHEHSTEGGTGTVVMSPEMNENGYWTVSCPHDACQGRGKLEFLEEMLKAEWFDEDCLTNPDYLLGADDEAEETAFAELPSGYVDRNGTINAVNTDDNDKIKFIPICQHFRVLGRASNIDGSAGAGRIIQFRNENGVDVEVTMDRSMLYKNDGGGILDVLADSGMEFHFRGPKGRALMLDLLRGIKSDKQVPVAPRPGWTRDRSGKVTGFMSPTGEFVPASPSAPEMRLHSNATVRDRQAMGEISKWQDAAATARYNTHWALGLCAGFAGPIIDLLELPTCGINLSGESSQGKTLALLLASTIWTTPKNGAGVLFVMNSTANAVEDMLTMGSGTFTGLDEIGAMQNPSALAAALFGAASGTGKNRKAGRGAGLAENAEFRTIGVMTNEHGLKETITSAGGNYKTGLSVRFPDVDVTENVKVGNDVIEVLEAAKENFGHAGPAFIRYLIEEGWHQRPNDLKERISKVANRLADSAAAPPLRRAANVFAIIQVAGELAVKAGLISKDVRPARAVRKSFETFKRSDEGRATSGGDNLIDGFRSWLVRSKERTIISATDASNPTYREPRGWITDTHVILDYEVLSDMKGMGLPGKRDGLLKALNKANALVKSGRNNYHNHLPSEVDIGGGPQNRQLRNVRILRSALGV